MDLQLTLTQSARETLDMMGKRVHEVRKVYGGGSVEYVVMLRSFATVLLTMMQMGGVVTAHNEVELLVQADFPYRVVFLHDGPSEDAMQPLVGEWEVV